MKRKVISLVLSLALLLSMTTIAGASSSSNDSYVILPEIQENYNCYTINFSTNGRIRSDEIIHSNIDKAISFVKGLNLDDKELGYIEDACLQELEILRTDNVLLQQYTVLTPKNGLTFFGTLNGVQYYWTETSIYVGTKSCTKS